MNKTTAEINFHFKKRKLIFNLKAKKTGWGMMIIECITPKISPSHAAPWFIWAVKYGPVPKVILVLP
jgi:hypothetical protein